MQGTWVQALIQEDPTCREATKPVRHNYWAHTTTTEPTPQLLSPHHNYWAHTTTTEDRAPRGHALQRRVAPRLLQLEKAHVQQQRPNAAKNK